jgi:hypothetical protein
LQGLQKRIGSVQLQPSKHAAAAKQSLMHAAGVAAVESAHAAAAAPLDTMPAQQQAVALTGLSCVQQTAGTGMAAAVAQQQAQASQASPLTQPGDAFARIALLKQQLQDSRTALQAIVTPTRGDLQPLQASTPCSAAANTAAGAGQQLQPVSVPADSSSTPPVSALAAAGLYAAAATGHAHSNAATPAAAVGAANTGTAAVPGADLRSGGGMRVSAGGSVSAWLSGGPLQQYLDRRLSTGRGARVSCSEGPVDHAAGSGRSGPTVLTPRSAEGRGDVSGSVAPFAAGGAGGRDNHSTSITSTNAGSAYVQGLVAKWRAAAAANEGQQAVGGVPPAAGPTVQQQALQHAPGDAFAPSWQQLLDQAYPGMWPSRQQGSTNTPVPAASRAGHSGMQAPGTSQWLSTAPPASNSGPRGSLHAAGKAAATVPSNALTPRASLFASLSPVPYGLADPNSASRGTGHQHLASNGTSSRPAVQHAQHSSVGEATPQNMATPGFANGFWALSTVTQGTPSNPGSGSAGGVRSFGSGSKGAAALRGILATGGSSSSSHSVSSGSSRTPPSNGNLARWTQQGSPTRQLRQQLLSAAKDYQLQEQQRQQQLQAVQVAPVSAALAHSVAVVDRTLAGLRSVSPATSMGHSSAAPSYAVSAHSSIGGSFATPNSGSSRGPVDVLAGAAAAAEALRDSLLAAAAQGAAARSVSPVQRLRQQGWASLT